MQPSFLMFPSARPYLSDHAVQQAVCPRLAVMPICPSDGERSPPGPPPLPVLCHLLPRLQAGLLLKGRRLWFCPWSLRGPPTPLQVPHTALQGWSAVPPPRLLLCAPPGRAPDTDAHLDAKRGGARGGWALPSDGCGGHGSGRRRTGGRHRCSCRTGAFHWGAWCC